MVRSGFRYAAPRKDHARLGTLNFLTEEARRIAANIVKLPDLIRRYTAFANSKLGNSDGEARKRSPDIPAPACRSPLKSRASRLSQSRAAP